MAGELSAIHSMMGIPIEPRLQIRSLLVWMTKDENQLPMLGAWLFISMVVLMIYSKREGVAPATSLCKGTCSRGLHGHDAEPENT